MRLGVPLQAMGPETPWKLLLDNSTDPDVATLTASEFLLVVGPTSLKIRTSSMFYCGFNQLFVVYLDIRLS